MVELAVYKMMVEQVKDYALFLLAPDGRILTWNLGAQLIKGYAPEEIIGRHFSVFYTREAIESRWPEHEIKVATAEGRFEDESWRVRKDGSRFWANVVITALRDEEGKLVGFSKITRDLSDRRLHEEALRQSEERFRLLIEGVQDYAIYMIDPEGIITSWNSGAERIKGYAREDVIGRHFSRFYAEEDIRAGKPWEELAAARRDGRAEDQGWRVKKSGERFWARVVVSALYDDHGHLRGFAKVTQDLTQQRHIQDMEKAARNVNEFIATLAHELRNPLAPIRNAVQIMAGLPASDPAQASMREMIERQSAQLARIVDDMVDISRITRGALTMEYNPIDLRDVVKRAVETSAPAIEAARHSLDVDLPAETLTVRGDVHRLTQLLANVVNNAARYTPEGGWIGVRARREDGHAVVRVRDSGRGIEPGMLERIFGMFVQGRSPLERVGAGLGIGLALARRIAELHGGTLDVVSEGSGKGSEFTLRLPFAAREAAHPPAKAPAPPQPIAARRILVVDDNADAARALEMVLKSLGHDTRVEHQGERALKAAAQFRPEVVLLDLGMPGMDGYELARHLRAALGPSLKVIAVTGWGQEADRERTREAGFDVHLVKPVDPQQLARILSDRNGATLH